MKARFVIIVVTLLMLASAAPLARAQGSSKKGPEVMRDPDMEKDSQRNLEAARLYFKLRKAYVASLLRCEEVLAGNPTFSKVDEVLFIAGRSSLNLAEGKGKQQMKQYSKTATSEELRTKARDYLSQLVNDYPQSSFLGQAAEDLKSLGGPKPKDSKQ